MLFWSCCCVPYVIMKIRCLMALNVIHYITLLEALPIGTRDCVTDNWLCECELYAHGLLGGHVFVCMAHSLEKHCQEMSVFVYQHGPWKNWWCTRLNSGQFTLQTFLVNYSGSIYLEKDKLPGREGIWLQFYESVPVFSRLIGPRLYLRGYHRQAVAYHTGD